MTQQMVKVLAYNWTSGKPLPELMMTKFYDILLTVTNVNCTTKS